jgi:hypothetical protein
MISEATARSEVKLVKHELKVRLKQKDYEEVLRLTYYLDFLDFALNFKED